MLGNIYVIKKKIGQTPLECINNLKNTRSDLANVPLTYAGRLDPLAEGVLLILEGDKCLKKDEYLSLDKEYEIDILFGFSTDTYDLMGKVLMEKSSSEVLFERSSDLLAKFFRKLGQSISNSTSDFAYKIKEIIPNFVGGIRQSYPPYSSRTVQGKPLFKWAREDRLNEIEIPTHDVFVESIDILEEYFISGFDLLNKIQNNISLVKGDFRQDEILKLWQQKLENKKEEKYKVIKLKIVCGSGVYVRGIANGLGLALGVPALALHIKRTRVGEYTI